MERIAECHCGAPQGHRRGANRKRVYLCQLPGLPAPHRHRPSIPAASYRKDQVRLEGARQRSTERGADIAAIGIRFYFLPEIAASNLVLGGVDRNPAVCGPVAVGAFDVMAFPAAERFDLGRDDASLASACHRQTLR